MKPTHPNDVPFGIENAVLAFALDLAGVPAANPPCVNLYSAETLFDLGGGKKDAKGNVTRPSRYAGMKTLEAAKTAFAEQKSGSVKYRFQRSKNLEALCKAFSDQERKVKVGETVNTTETVDQITKQMISGEIDRAEGIVRLACLIVKTYNTFKNQWKGVVPDVKISNPGKTKKFKTHVERDGKVYPATGVSQPGFRIVSLNASPETLERLGM